MKSHVVAHLMTPSPSQTSSYIKSYGQNTSGGSAPQFQPEDRAGVKKVAESQNRVPSIFLIF